MKRDNGSAASVAAAVDDLTSGFDLDNDVDIKAIEDEPIIVHIQNVKKEKMFNGKEPVTMTVVGTYSKTYRRRMAAQQKRSRGGGAPSGDEFDLPLATIVAGCVSAWSGFKASKSGADELPCTKDNVLKVFVKHPYVLDQVFGEMNTHENFIERNSENSPST